MVENFILTLSYGPLRVFHTIRIPASTWKFTETAKQTDRQTEEESEEMEGGESVWKHTYKFTIWYSLIHMYEQITPKNQRKNFIQFMDLVRLCAGSFILFLHKSFMSSQHPLSEALKSWHRNLKVEQKKNWKPNVNLMHLDESQKISKYTCSERETEREWYRHFKRIQIGWVISMSIQFESFIQSTDKWWK